jgi:hypothetical protein
MGTAKRTKNNKIQVARERARLVLLSQKLSQNAADWPDTTRLG